MRYLVVQDWDNTHGNHAGMVHMCKLLCEKYPEKYRMIVKECVKPIKKRKAGLLDRLLGWFDRRRFDNSFKKEYIALFSTISGSLHSDDEVFLLEYNLPMVNQYHLAKYLNKTAPDVRIYALTHLTPTWFKLHKGSENLILKWDKVVDKHLTLGTSLSCYLKAIDVDPSKISTGFHYVDNDYYFNDKSLSLHQPITIISIGALQRDFNMLSEIVHRCNNVNWIICKGRKNIDDLFKGLSNVELVGYVGEEELKEYMSKADLSMNVLEDTVGSNVITTSMAMGLGLVVSDVGSIHDYCDTSNAVFCNNDADSFVDAINKLTAIPETIEKMRFSSVQRVSRFSIEKVDEWFDSLNN